MENDKEYFKLFTVKDGSQVLFEKKFRDKDDDTEHVITCVIHFHGCRAENDYGYSSEGERDKMFDVKVNQDFAQKQYDAINELINK